MNKRNYSWDDMIGSDIPKEKNSEKKTGGKSVPVSVSLSENLLEKLDQFCYWNRVTRSSVVEKLAEKLIERYEKSEGELKKIPKKNIDDIL